MKRILLFFAAALLCAGGAAAQSAPRWMDSQSRAMLYPNDTYVTGFAQGMRLAGETLEQAFARLKKDATGELIGGIRSHVKNVTQVQTVQDANYNVSSVFAGGTATVAEGDIAALNTEQYMDESSGMLYAFAYVRRADLIAYYQNQIGLKLGAVESTLQTAKQLAAAGEKPKALAACQKVSGLFAAVSEAQNLLAATDPLATDMGLQQQRSTALQSELSLMLSALEGSIRVFVKCDLCAVYETVADIPDQLQGLLTDGGCDCNFVDSETAADYVITLVPNIRCNDPTEHGQVFCYATASVSITNARSGKTMKPQIGEAKGGWTNYNTDRATAEAYKELVKIIADKVMPYFKK
jgi:hypothetical protein